MTETLIHEILLLLVLPAWLLVGLADWYCHRRTQIERTTGTRESVLHLVLAFEASVAILAGMFFEIDTLILAIVVAAFIAHEVTTNLDVHIALPGRCFTPTEQRLHDYLTAIPFAAVALLLATHTDQLAGLLGAKGYPPNWSLRWKSPPLPFVYLIGWNIAALLLNVAPYTEELIRCLRTSRSSETSAPRRKYCIS